MQRGRPDCGFDIRHNYWYIDSKKLGRVSLGRTGGAAEGVTEMNLAHTKDVAKYSDVEDSGLGIFLRNSNGGLSGLQWRRLIGDIGVEQGEGERRSVIKYDTPEFKGFTATAAWGTTTIGMWACAMLPSTMAIEILAGIAYGENTDYADSATARKPSSSVCIRCAATSDAKCNRSAARSASSI